MHGHRSTIRFTRDRDGVALLDALVALVMLGLIATMLAGSVRVQVHAAADVTARTEARRALRAAAAPLISELRHAIPAGDDALLLEGDQLRIRTTVAGGAACVAADGRVALLGAPPLAPLAAWRAMPDSRDALLVLLEDAPGDRCDRWSEFGIASASVASSPPAPCTSGGGGTTALIAPAGVPIANTGDTVLVQVARRVTWRLTSSAEGWFLSRARCDGGAGTSAPTCDAPQPVAGPFLPPADGGFVLRPLAADGTPLGAVLQHDARAVELRLVAPVAARRPDAAPHESLHVVVPLPRPCS